MDQHNFAKGSIGWHMMNQSVPLIIAEFISALYSVIDRIYLGHLPEGGSIAIAGVGVTFPVILFYNAVMALFRSGGAPLYSIARGMKDEERAQRILF